jgi:hypothetical protein
LAANLSKSKTVPVGSLHLPFSSFVTFSRVIRINLDLWCLGFESFLKVINSGTKVCLGEGEKISGHDQRLA